MLFRTIAHSENWVTPTKPKPGKECKKSLSTLLTLISKLWNMFCYSIVMVCEFGNLTFLESNDCIFCFFHVQRKTSCYINQFRWRQFILLWLHQLLLISMVPHLLQNRHPWQIKTKLTPTVFIIKYVQTSVNWIPLYLYSKLYFFWVLFI